MISGEMCDNQPAFCTVQHCCSTTANIQRATKEINTFIYLAQWDQHWPHKQHYGDKRKLFLNKINNQMGFCWGALAVAVA